MENRLAHTISRRDIRSIDPAVYNLEDFDSILVAKFGETGIDEVDDYWQNKREVRNFIENKERGGNIFPDILGGKKDFSVIIAEYKQPLYHKSKDLPRQPEWEDWVEHDGLREPTTDWGIDNKKLVPLDYGKILPQGEYQHARGEIDNVLERSEFYNTTSDEYFIL